MGFPESALDFGVRLGEFLDNTYVYIYIYIYMHMSLQPLLEVVLRGEVPAHELAALEPLAEVAVARQVALRAWEGRLWMIGHRL